MKKIIKHTIASVLLSFAFSSCGETETEQQDRILTELKCPVILIAKTGKGTILHKIVVRDAHGRFKTFAASSGDGFKLPNAIANSINVGDTLKPCY
jgi:dethiobiotin synthetase